MLALPGKRDMQLRCLWPLYRFPRTEVWRVHHLPEGRISNENGGALHGLFLGLRRDLW